MALPVAPTILIVIVIVGSLIQLIFNRDDWPLSNYSMYSYLVRDYEHNPFVPMRKDQKAEAGFLVLAIRLADGTSVPLTTKYANPLLMPFERLRIIRHLTTIYKKGGDVTPALARLAAWVHRRNIETGANQPIEALALDLYLWRTIPDAPQRHHTPDEIIEVGKAALPS